MAILPINPSVASPSGGSEWSVGGINPGAEIGPVDPSVSQPAGGPSGGFGGMLTNAITSLEKTQTDAAGASQSLIAGTASDPTQVVMAVERARLSMQLASQLRNKAVEAYTDIFHTQV
jgi:flagellar hook-basal body complex protein FliE